LGGTRLAFDIDVDDIGEDRQSVDFGGEFIPYFQYIFLPDRRVRPYLEGRFGIIGGTRIRDVDVLELEDVRESRTTVAPTVGGGAGLHIWLIDEFSIDVALNADYWAPFTQVGFDEDVGDIDSDFNRTGDAVNVSLMTGLSVWF
jgi:hypothetical protein